MPSTGSKYILWHEMARSPLAGTSKLLSNGTPENENQVSISIVSILVALMLPAAQAALVLGVPVAQGYSVYGDFPWRHPLWSGFHGLGVPSSLPGADLFINLGGAMPGPGIFTSPPPRSAKVIEARVEYDAIDWYLMP